MTPNEQNQTVKETIKQDITRRVVAGFLDLFVVNHFKNVEFGGYDVIQYVNKQLNVWLSPGTVYSVLYSMQRKGYLECCPSAKKRVFKVSEKGVILGEFLSCPGDVSVFVEEIISKSR